LALLEVEGLTKTFGSGDHAVPAVRGVDVTIERGETVALVGESGCGKSTTARVLAGLTGATSGRVRLDGDELDMASKKKDMRRRVQMVFQHPEQSLNPMMKVDAALREPLKLLSRLTGEEADQRIDEVIRAVGLTPAYLQRRPGQMSGGQQQRVAIARALVVRPELVILDEPTASLDQSIRARIISLLRALQEQFDVGYLFISHDLSVVRRIADRVAVMYLGRIVEEAPTKELFETPQHPYTQALLSAVPVMDPRRARDREVLPGETPSPSSLPPGCAFQDRCVLAADHCRQQHPELLPYHGSRHLVECHAVHAPPGTWPVQVDEQEAG
jgi:oligopeptide/dipeptide ABC transporter ATP-binding protein